MVNSMKRVMLISGWNIFDEFDNGQNPTKE